jgi:hypothetical protein
MYLPNNLAQSSCQLITSAQWPVHVTFLVWDRTMPRQHCTNCTVSKILHVWKNRQNTISHSYDIHLNPFQLNWDLEDETYAHVYFEAIPITLIFEQILIPWITPPHWEAFGPPKDYFQSI